MRLFEPQATIEQHGWVDRGYQKPISSQLTKYSPGKHVRPCSFQRQTPLEERPRYNFWEHVTATNPSRGGERLIAMSTTKEFKCEICGIMTATPMHWFI